MIIVYVRIIKVCPSNNTAVVWMLFSQEIHFDWTRFKNSSRVFESSLNTPNMVEVTVLLFIF